jgi:hypothetical protein
MNKAIILYACVLLAGCATQSSSTLEEKQAYSALIRSIEDHPRALICAIDFLSTYSKHYGQHNPDVIAHVIIEYLDARPEVVNWNMLLCLQSIDSRVDGDRYLEFILNHIDMKIDNGDPVFEKTLLLSWYDKKIVTFLPNMLKHHDATVRATAQQLIEEMKVKDALDN